MIKLLYLHLLFIRFVKRVFLLIGEILKIDLN